MKTRDKRLYIQNVGLVKIRMHRSLEGEINTVTIKRESEKWHAIFSNTVAIDPLPVSHKAIGIDVGLESFAVTSDGEYIDNPRYLGEAEATLRRSQRSVSRKKMGSRSRRKAIILLAKQHLTVKRQRKDFAHKTARDLVNIYGLIAVEDLKIKNMVKNHHLARSINDAAWGQFVSILSYKAEYAGREFVQVNPNGTSQICSECGSVVPKSLSTRVHNCPRCGRSLNHDLNAALNIKQLGLSLWDKTWHASTSCPKKPSALADGVVTEYSAKAGGPVSFVIVNH